MQHTCSPNQGEQGFSSASWGLEFMKVRGSALPVLYSLSLGKVCKCQRHPWDTGTSALWAPFLFNSPWGNTSLETTQSTAEISSLNPSPNSLG